MTKQKWKMNLTESDIKLTAGNCINAFHCASSPYSTRTFRKSLRFPLLTSSPYIPDASPKARKSG